MFLLITNGQFVIKKVFFQIRSQASFKHAVVIWDDVESKNIYLSNEKINTAIEEAQLWQASLLNIPIAIESRLSWLQVLEFRKDTGNRKKYLRLKHWLSDSLNATSLNHAQELIELRIEDYKLALKKHGIEVAHGVSSAIISPKAIFPGLSGAVGSVLSMPGNPLAILATAGISYLAGVGVELLNVKAKCYDAETLDGREVAYLHDIKTAVLDSEPMSGLRK